MRSLLVCAALLLSVPSAFACKMSESHRAVLMLDEALKIVKEGNLYNGKTITSLKVEDPHVNVYSKDNETGECTYTQVKVSIHPDCSVTAKPTADTFACEQ